MRRAMPGLTRNPALFKLVSKMYLTDDGVKVANGANTIGRV